MSSENGELTAAVLCAGDPPSTESICSDNPDCDHQVPRSSHVEHNAEADREGRFHWRKGEWSKVYENELL